MNNGTELTKKEKEGREGEGGGKEREGEECIEKRMKKCKSRGGGKEKNLLR